MTRLPQPLSVTGRVTFDPVTRSLFAHPAEAGLGSLIWRQGLGGDARPVGLPTGRQLRALPVGPPYTIEVLCHDSSVRTPRATIGIEMVESNPPVAGSRNVAMSSAF